MDDTENTDDPFPLEANFIEQAEYLEKARFLQLTTEHPEEDAIIKKLTGGGAKLLIGPRGCGKSTLMLKAYYRMLSLPNRSTLPIYVNFKLALKLEPLYHKSSNAGFWFRLWLSLKVLQSLHNTLIDTPQIEFDNTLPNKFALSRALQRVETGMSSEDDVSQYTVEHVQDIIDHILSLNDISRCVLLIDDAAHAFSEKQQEDFFDFFRAIKSRKISPKAAVYPGVTSHSPSFHVGHDAERVDVWVRPQGKNYEDYMIDMAKRRFGTTPHDFIDGSREEVCLLAYSAFGIPRAFLSMIRTIADSPATYLGSDARLQRRKVVELSRQGRDMAHATFTSLSSKLPAYKTFVDSGGQIYQAILKVLKDYNSNKPLSSQGFQFGLKAPAPPEIEKTLGFLQYSGLVMPAGDTMRGVKGSYELYDIHFGDLIAENTIVGRRTKSVSSFLEVLRATKHQAWPRINASSGLTDTEESRLGIPSCSRSCESAACAQGSPSRSTTPIGAISRPSPRTATRRRSMSGVAGSCC